MSIKTYSELMTLDNFEDRLCYLKIYGLVGVETFGGHRYLNQVLYQMSDWRRIRRQVILRDNGCDLAHEDYPIFDSIYVHHINPITIEDILRRRSCVLDLENLVSTSFRTHNYLHYGVEEPITKIVERKPNDTCPWR